MFTIERTKSGVSITFREFETVTLTDGSTREIETKKTTIGFGDSDFAADKANPTEEELNLSKQRMLKAIEANLGADFSSALADAAISTEQVNSLKSQLAAARAEVAKEKAEKLKITTGTIDSSRLKTMV